MRGRVMALYGLLFLGSTPVGGPLLGWISQRWGPRAGLALGGAFTLVAAAGVSGVRARRRWVAAGVAPDDGSGAPDAIVAA
jgi:MFS family permease